MNFTKISILLLFIYSMSISCKEEKQKIAPTANLKKVEFHIKGMTCERGCTRLIQSKLSKVEGIANASVSFKDSLGMVEYDANKISGKNIVAAVQSIADGDSYKTSDRKEVTEFSINTK